MLEVATRLERAWAAGFFDGDGWAGTRRESARPIVRPTAQINQAGSGIPSTLLRFRRAVDDVGNITGPTRKVGRRDLYAWVASKPDDVLHTFEQVGPWLCAAKFSSFVVVLPDAKAKTAVRTTEEELAWAAGFFDAEGCTSLAAHRSHAGYHVVEMAVTQQSAEGQAPELLRFQTAVGGRGRVYGPYRQASARSDVYRWKAYNVEEVSEVFESLRPYLAAVKVQQAELAIRVVRAQSPLPRGRTDWGSHKTHCIHGHEYAAARVRPYRSRGVGEQRRDNKQCLVCTREQAKAKRDGLKNEAAASRPPLADSSQGL